MLQQRHQLVTTNDQDSGTPIAPSVISVPDRDLLNTVNSLSINLNIKFKIILSTGDTWTYSINSNIV
ncbi:uncharacterized protein OCT59_008541 [Rhizophagus irregularis]|uniref:uncharacterized protein n=1 Tax=Rhizophagus irregularis TaxID=588596 RepID=UPI0033181109|nr:hypothetical protein OCT59_008541 [Rhizophagus irregularis]